MQRHACVKGWGGFSECSLEAGTTSLLVLNFKAMDQAVFSPEDFWQDRAVADTPP